MEGYAPSEKKSFRVTKVFSSFQMPEGSRKLSRLNGSQPLSETRHTYQPCSRRHAAVGLFTQLFTGIFRPVDTVGVIGKKWTDRVYQKYIH